MQQVSAFSKYSEDIMASKGLGKEAQCMPKKL